MTVSESSPSSSTKSFKKTKQNRSRTTRAPSASEIARNIEHFETWSTHQNTEQLSLSDLPDHLVHIVRGVFDVNGCLPLSWVDKNSKDFKRLKQLMPPDFPEFISDAFKQCPSLFKDNNSHDIPDLLHQLNTVFLSWTRLKEMRKSDEKWSEADFVGTVYGPLRTQSIKQSTHRHQRPLSLPQPIITDQLGPEASRIMRTKSVIPDTSIFIPTASIRDLASTKKSAYTTLKNLPAIRRSGAAGKCSSFRYQVTPSLKIPDTARFEFISSVWEDKKPGHDVLGAAYRQNRMSTTSVVRHLSSLNIEAPVFGLVWANATVRAHVDWSSRDQSKRVVIHSAPFPPIQDTNSGEFHEWQLENAADIIQVHLIMRNIDFWTCDGFLKRVSKSINTLEALITNASFAYKPWRHDKVPVSERRKSTSKENVYPSNSTAISTPPKPKRSTRRK